MGYYLIMFVLMIILCIFNGLILASDGGKPLSITALSICALAAGMWLEKLVMLG